MSTKNPYELRTDLLIMAQEHALTQFKANMDFATMAFQKMSENFPQKPFKSMDEWELAMRKILEDFSKVAPKMPSLTEIEENAKKMYDTFVKVNS